MRQHSEQLGEVLSGSFGRRYFVNVFHGSDIVAEGLPLVSWSLDEALSADIGASGSGVILASSVSGESWSPVGTTGALSPFRAQIEIVCEVSAGEFVERVSLGVFSLVKVPSAVDSKATVDGVDVVIESEVSMTFLGLEDKLLRRGFRFPEASAKGASAWSEMRRLSGMAVEVSVPDVALGAAMTWEAAQGGRLKALRELASALGGELIVNSRGALTVVPETLGAPVGALRLGALGTVTEIGSEIDTDGVYNVVVGSFEDDNRNPFYSVAEVTSGDLATSGLFGESVRYYSSDLVKTRAQGDAAVASVLAASIDSQMYDVQVQCHVNPVVEIGDIWEVDGWDRPLSGRVTKIGLSEGELMTVTLRTKRVLS